MKAAKVIYYVEAENGRKFIATFWPGRSIRGSRWQVEIIGISALFFECTQKEAFNFEEAVYRTCLHHKIDIPELKDYDA